MDILASIGGCIHQVSLTYGLLGSLFLAGLVGSVSHCTLMCGPFVISQAGGLSRLQDVMLVPYHLGRMTTYVTLSVLVYSVLNLVFLYSPLKSIIAAPMLFLAGIIFLVSAFPKTKALFPWVANIRFYKMSVFLEKASSKLFSNHGLWSRYGLGVLLGFMPCGLVVAALMASATAPTVWQAAFSMMAFSVGTVPALVLVAMGAGSLKHRYPEFSLRFSQLAKIISALWLFVLAGSLVL